MSSLMERLKNKKAVMNANRRAKTVKPTADRSRWRILPSWRKPDHAEPDQFYHDFGSHFIKDQSGELKAVYICVNKTFNKTCPICAAVNSAINNESDPETKKLFESSRATGRILMNALQVDGENPNEPVLFEVPPTVFEQMLNVIFEWGTEVISLDEGKDFVIERSGKGLLTKYSVQIAAKSKPVSADVMKKLTNIDDYVKQESEENANRALSNFRQVAGLLPASVSGLTDAPARTSMSSMLVEDEEDDAALVELEKSIHAAPAVAEKAAPVAEKAAPVAEKAAKAPAAPVSGDAELDELLAALG